MFNNCYTGKRVLVTGHTGFKGSWLVMWLISLGAKVGGYSLYIPSNPSLYKELDIDHQIRTIIGTLREEKMLDDTIIVFCSDHGEMLGEHGLYAKRVMYENSCNIPMIISGTPNEKRLKKGLKDNRLVGLQDVMPTLLDLANIKIPETCTGISMIKNLKRKI